MLSSSAAISLLCLVLFINPVPISSQQTTPAVLDTAGHAIKSNTRYFILPAGAKSGGGPTLVNHNSSCPSSIGQDIRVGSRGLPVIFTPSSSETTVRESSDFTIRFNVTTATCVESTEWALVDWPASTGRTLIKTTTRATSTAHSTVTAYLKIERQGKYYKLVWCPSNLCPRCTPRCGDVGVYVEKNVRLLALYEPALSIVFRKA
ncbi:hypothetical protein ACHQM5_024407 [Ranunculus cassubicifolius]